MAEVSKDVSKELALKLRVAPPRKRPGFMTWEDLVKPFPNDYSKIPELLKDYSNHVPEYSVVSNEINFVEDLLNKLKKPAEHHKLVESNIMEYLKDFLDTITADAWEDDKKMFVNSAQVELVKKMHGKIALLHKDREPMKTMFGYTHVMGHIKGNNGDIMGRINDIATSMKYCGIIGTAAKTAAMGRATICSLAQFGSSFPMDPYYCLKLDSGAGIHAVGDYMMLKDFTPFCSDIPFLVALPDGSELRSVGVGTIETERFSIPNVHLVDGLRNNLISVSQLDERHRLCCVFFHNHCRVIDSNGQLVGGAILQDNGLYVLSYLKVPV